MKPLRTFFVLAAFVAGFFIFISPASATKYIATSTVWREVDSPIITNDRIVILPGGKLTIEPGVAVKFAAPNMFDRVIDNAGTLDAIGRIDKPIIFTSINDDSAGGDTNHNGTSTVSGPGDWWRLYLNTNSHSILNNIIIRYGGYESSGAIVAHKADLVVKNCTITKNIIGIRNESGRVTVSNCAIFDNITNSSGLTYDYGISNFANYGDIITEVIALDNWWGTSTGPCLWSSTFPNGRPINNADIYRLCKTRPRIDAKVVYSPWLDTVPIPEQDIDKRHPVILIPGFLGSWPDSIGDFWVMDPILHTYDDLLDALQLAGYEDNKTLFTLPYDWMKSNVVTAQLLKDKINAVKSVCVADDTYGCSKVDLIGHSMGGIVARQYIESDDYQNDVDQLIFIATPHKGAPDSYLMLEAGDIHGYPVINYVFKKFMQVKAEINGYKSRPFYDGLMYYVREQVYSLGEVLPIYDYIRDVGTGLMRQYPNDYPTNSFLENLNLPFNLAKLDQVKIANILGDAGNATINAFRVIPPLLYPLDGKWQHGIPENYNNYFSDRGLELGVGDDTVPKYSNSSFNGISDTIIPNASHLAIVSLAQAKIIKELTGQEPETIITSTIIDHLLIFQIFSPADFQVIAPDGRIIGRNFNSNVIYNELVNGYYTGFRNSSTPEMVIISNPMVGDYQIKLIGTESGGSYKMSVSSMNDAISSESSYSGVILPNQQQEINLSYLATSSAVSSLRPDITIKTAIADVEMIYDQGLLISSNAKKKIIKQYESLIDEVEKQHKKDKLEKIVDELKKLDKYLVKLVDRGVLKQLGYDIIKSNNDYLINNLQ